MLCSEMVMMKDFDASQIRASKRYWFDMESPSALVTTDVVHGLDLIAGRLDGSGNKSAMRTSADSLLDIQYHSAAQALGWRTGYERCVLSRRSTDGGRRPAGPNEQGAQRGC
jgi:hypothetical protein